MLNCKFTQPDTSARQIFLDGLEKGQFLYQYDEKAGRAVFYPREVGPSGNVGALVWRESGGEGAIYSFTVLHKAQERRNIVLVDLDEGFRMMSTIVNCNADALRIGMRVRAKIEPDEAGCRLVYEVSDDV